VEAQILKFLSTGLEPTHIDGHLHFQVHPAVSRVVVELAKRYEIPAFRLPREPLWLNLRLNRENSASKIAHGLIYRRLCAGAEKLLLARGIPFPDRYFGLLASGRMDERYLLGVITALGPGVTEIGMHPAAAPPPEMREWAPDYQYEKELRALLSPKVRDAIGRGGIRLAHYGELARRDTTRKSQSP
jgi:hypothetical protein